MSQDRIKRSAFYCFIALVASFAGLFTKLVLINGGAFTPNTSQIVIAIVSSVLVGFIVPIVEDKKKRRA